MKLIFRIFFLLLLSVDNVNAQQDTICIYNSSNPNLFIGKSAFVYQDTSLSKTILDLNSNPKLFTKSTTDAINFGVNNFNNWIRIVFENKSDNKNFVLNISNPQIDFVSFYAVKEASIDSFSITEKSSLSQRLFNHSFFLFNLNLVKGEKAVCYFKVKSNKQILIPIQVATTNKIPILISEQDSLSGLYLGIMLAMILYNLFVYFSAKDRHYLYYCHYIFWVAVTQAVLVGFAHRLGCLENSWLMPRLLTFVGAMSGIATIIFVKSFLNIKITVPKLSILLNAIIVGDIIAISLLFFKQELNAYNFVNLTAGLGSLIVLFVAIMVLRKDYKPARFFLFGWTFFLSSVIVFVLKDVGVLPYNVFTVRSVQIGSVIEAMLLSFALADKLNILKKEKEQSQLEALEAARENERIIREQNVLLEEKVTERTIELKATNENLSDTLENLKQAQSQLVESEKMASLGQLTAGIAHEINNPINFVTSNVAPLKRDIGMVFDAIEFIEQTGLSDEISVGEKKKKIDDYKEDLDYDYLKTEINHLLNGIYEGSSRTAEIVKGLRIFSRVDENDLKRADINEGLDSTLIIVNNLLNSTISIKKDYANNMPPIECYPGKLNQVFLNIISNAIHAIRQKYGDAPKGCITIVTKAFEHHISVEFIDNGVGMDEATQHKIYEPFFTTKEVGEGTGLGMSIVYNTIKKHNGTIKLSSKIGEGSSFLIELPINFES